MSYPGVPFKNDIAGGGNLIIPFLQSPNFIAGVQGWRISRNGDVEFATGTFRGPVVVIDPTTGEVLASIGANGNIAGQFGSFTDVIVNGQSLADYLANAPRGIVGRFTTTANLPASGVSGTFTDTCWTRFQYEPGRRYKITTTATQWINNNISANQDFIVRIILNQPGVTGGAANVVHLATRQSCSGSESQSWNIDYEFGANGLYASGQMTVAMQMAAVDVNTFTNLNPSGSPFTLRVDDIGPVITSVGGTGAPTGLGTWTVKYFATASRSYDGSGVFIGAPDGNNNMYRSTFPDRPFSNEQFECIFNGAQLRSDLSGATINYARLWLYCVKAEEAAGSIEFGVTTDTAVQGTLTDNSTGSYAADDIWPNPGWTFYDLISGGAPTALSKFLTTGNGIIGRTSFFGLAATGFSGFGGPADRKPYIEVQYVGNPPGVTSGYGTAPYGQVGYGA